MRYLLAIPVYSQRDFVVEESKEHHEIPEQSLVGTVGLEPTATCLEASFPPSISIQIQLAAERVSVRASLLQTSSPFAECGCQDDPSSEWAIVKAKIRTQVGEIPFLNWFDATRQVERQGAEITLDCWPALKW